MMRKLLLLGLALALPAGCADGDASGCSKFNPVSEPIALGETVIVEVDVRNGYWATPDVAGGYFEIEQGEGHEENRPPAALVDATLLGAATLVNGEIGAGGTVIVGVVEIDFPDIGTYRFTGPIGCA